MKHLAIAATVLALGLGVTAGSGFAPMIGDALAATKQERAAARTAMRTKRVECRKQADAQKLRMIKRSRFLRTCQKG